jgi:hypothetical protein
MYDVSFANIFYDDVRVPRGARGAGAARRCAGA